MLQIFTEDLPEVENLPRDTVLAYLEKIGKELAIPYLVSKASENQKVLFGGGFS